MAVLYLILGKTKTAAEGSVITSEAAGKRDWPCPELAKLDARVPVSGGTDITAEGQVNEARIPQASQRVVRCSP
jgi:hypothetical protein